MNTTAPESLMGLPLDALRELGFIDADAGARLAPATGALGLLLLMNQTVVSWTKRCWSRRHHFESPKPYSDHCTEQPFGFPLGTHRHEGTLAGAWGFFCADFRNLHSA